MDYFESKESVTISIRGDSSYDRTFFDLMDLDTPSDYGISTELDIIAGGCFLEEKEGYSYNCTKACLDPKLAFQDMATVQNCINYPYIVSALGHNNLTIIDDMYSDRFESYSFMNLSSLDVQKIGEVIFNCFNEFSEDQNGCAPWYEELLSEDVCFYPF